MKTTIKQANPIAVYDAFYELSGGLMGTPAILPDGRLILVFNADRLENAGSELRHFVELEYSEWPFVHVRGKYLTSWYSDLASRYLRARGIPLKLDDGIYIVDGKENYSRASKALQNLKDAEPDILLVEGLVDKTFESFGDDVGSYLGASGG